jgi:hypothetical protein
MADASFTLPVRMNPEDVLTLIERVFATGAPNTLTQVTAEDETGSGLDFAWESSIEIPDLIITLCPNGTWLARQILHVVADDGS